MHWNYGRRRAPCPPSTGTRSTTAASSATSARAPASCTRASAACASSAPARTTRSCSPPTAARAASASTRSRRSRCNHFLPGTLGALVRHGRLQPRVPLLPELGHLEVEGDRHARRRGVARRRSRAPRSELGCRSVAFTYNDPMIFLEYAIDVADACRADGHRSGRGHRRLHLRRTARASSTRTSTRPTSTSRAFTEDFYRHVCGGHLGAVLDTLEYLVHETDVWVEIDDAADPGPERQRRRARRDDARGSSSTSAPTCRCTSPRSIPTSRCSTSRRRRPPTLTRAREIALGQRRALRVHRQRARRARRQHLLPGVRRAA